MTRALAFARLGLAAIAVPLRALADTPPPFQVSRVSPELGLSHNWVLSVLKDRRGFLWVGTQSGLNRYDGVSFRVYRHEPSDARTLPSSVAGVLHEDGRGRLWVGSLWGAPGLARYDRERDDFERFPRRPGPGCLDLPVRALADGANGRLWAATNRGLCLVDPDRDTYEAFPLTAKEWSGGGDANVDTLAAAGPDTLWVGGRAGLLLFDTRSGRYSRWPQGGKEAIPGGILVRKVLPAGPEKLWVATAGDGLFELDLVGGRTRQYLPRAGEPASLSVATLSSLALDAKRRLWIGTQNGGLELLDPRTGVFIHHRPAIDDDRSLGSASVATLHADDEGIVWIGTYDVGLSYVSPYEQAFRHLGARLGGLSSARVGSVLEDRAGNVWIGTNSTGLDRWDPRTGTFTHFRHDPRNDATLGSNAVFGLLETADGAIWTGGWGAGLGRLDPRSGRVQRFRHDPRDAASLPSNNVWKILELRNGDLLVTTQLGTSILDRRKGRFRRVSVPHPIDGDDRYAAAEDADGNLWLGGVAGAQFVDRARGTVVDYAHDPAKADGLGPGWVMSALVDSRGNVWFGTESGLSVFSPGSGAWRRFTTRDGLGHETVMGVLEDSAGHLWLSTIRGVTRFENAARLPAKPHFSNFESRDGLANTNFTRGAASRGPSGRLYFGGGYGLSYFAPDQVVTNPRPPPVVFTGLRVLNEWARPGGPGSPLPVALSEARALVVSHRDSMLTFEFAALNFVLPHKNRYAFRLEGLDPGWNEAGSQNTATYTRIPPGRYTMRVRAANNDGVWNEEGVRLPLTVTPPWWRTLWFRSLLAAAIVGGLVLAHGWRTRRIKARATLLARLVEERTAEVRAANKELEAFAYSVSHDLRAPLRSIDGYSNILLTDSGPRLDGDGRRLLGLVRDRARRMEQLIDDLLAFSRLGRQGIAPTTVELGPMVTAVWEDLGRDDGRLPTLDLRPLDPAWCDPAMIRQVLVNLLANAVKFTKPVPEPVVEVGQASVGSETVYYVKDNGVGFDMRYADKLFGVFQRLHSADEFDGTGVGLAIVERIVRRHGGHVWAEAEVGKGARFSFSLPHAPSSREGA